MLLSSFSVLRSEGTSNDKLIFDCQGYSLTAPIAEGRSHVFLCYADMTTPLLIFARERHDPVVVATSLIFIATIC